jgi:hypothetical protein
MECDWLLQAPAGQVVQVVLSNISIEGSPGLMCADHVLAMDGFGDNAHTITDVCGESPPPSIIQSTGSTMRLRFRTDSSIRKSGFSARVTFAASGSSESSESSDSSIRFGVGPIVGIALAAAVLLVSIGAITLVLYKRAQAKIQAARATSFLVLHNVGGSVSSVV